MASLNDLMHRFYEKFFRSGDRLPVDVGGQITVEEISIGEVKQGARGENAEPWQVTLTGSNVALPVDLQYHDLETPLPVSIANQTSDAVRIVKEYIGVSPGATSLYLGQSLVTTGATVMELLDVSQYRTISVYVHNRTGAALHFRAFVFSHLAETHFENGAVMGVWQQSAIPISDGEQRYITLHDADKIAELAWFGHVPLPYFGFQLRLVPGETFGEDPAVDAAVIGVVR